MAIKYQIGVSSGRDAFEPCAFSPKQRIKTVLLALAAVPLLAGAALAVEPLNDAQMDAMTAGFDALSTAEAQALGKIVTSESATVALVSAVTTSTGTPVQASLGETTLTLYQSVSTATSASLATNAQPSAAAGLSSP